MKMRALWSKVTFLVFFNILRKEFRDFLYKHSMFTDMVYDKSSKTHNFECKVCYYITSNKKDFAKHINTIKHKKRINVDEMLTDVYSTEDKIPKQYYCECGRPYKYRQSLYVHRKKCNFKNEKSEKMEKKSEENTENIDNIKYSNKNDTKIIHNNEEVECKSILLKSIEQQNLIIGEILPKLVLAMNTFTNFNNNNTFTNSNNTNNTNNINNTNHINQKLNLNIYLNETCKDAISLNEFVKNIEVTVNDLLFSKNEGIVKGVSNIFIKHLNKLPAVQRPVWCSDKKRKKIFVKEETWKEDVDNNKTKEAIVNISKTQSSNINKYIQQKPNWMSDDNDKSTYIDIVKTVTDDFSENKRDKVIDNIIDTIHLTQDKIV